MHVPQSTPQLEQVSDPLQIRSPQTILVHVPQSDEQVEQVSPPLQELSPQYAGVVVQSAGQVADVSPVSQILLPQTGGGLPGPQQLSGWVVVDSLQTPNR